MASTPRIALVGGGPGGLLLARYLQVHGIACTLYEGEKSRDARGQGGSLDLHAESGLAAMDATGLRDAFNKLSRPEGEQMVVTDSTGAVRFDSGEDEQSGRPEIDRADLRNILLDSISPETIKWDHRLSSVEPNVSDSTYRLNFTNQPSVQVDILIGADGAWSKIRPLLTPAVPLYSSISFIDYVLPSSLSSSPTIANRLGNGINFISSPGRGLITQRNSHETRVYVALKVDEDWGDNHPLPEEPEEVHQFLVDLFPGWDQSILDLLHTTAEAPPVHRKIYALPPTLRWTTPHKRLTVLGDAAHVMSPFAGEGVNLALLDALELGKALVRAVGEGAEAEVVDRELRAYERRMWETSEEKAVESAANLELMFGKGAPQSFVDLVQSYGPPPE
ncbi:hypothetical protein MNV49_004818 [Pseudohyphozyma bogoriensis]|nr:hypothetical protein MNV49_004818 [Pseudohyphozyma bogoriensis]